MDRDTAKEANIPASMTKFKGVKRKRYEERESEEEPMTCSICLEDLTADKECSSLPCSHVFHSSCVDQWLNRKRSCPNCRNVVESEGSDRLQLHIRIAFRELGYNLDFEVPSNMLEGDEVHIRIVFRELGHNLDVENRFTI